MGHFYTRAKGEGRSRQDAERDAIDRFIQENGTRHSVRGTSSHRLLERTPPMGVTRTEPDGTVVRDFTRRDSQAPQSQWNEVWELELHTHA